MLETMVDTGTDEQEDTDAADMVFALAASPAWPSDGVCFAACRSGLWRSSDGGRTWESAYQGSDLASPLATLSVAVSPSFRSDRTVFAGVPGGILRSIDGGRTWHTTLLPPPPPLVSTLVVSPTFVADGTVLAGTLEDGVYRSADRGHSWSPWNFGLLDLSILAMVISPGFADDETLFVGTETGIFRSTNGGRAWREVSFPGEYAPVQCLALSPTYPTDGVMFAGTVAHGLFRSDDDAETWTRMRPELIAGTVNAITLGTRFAQQPQTVVMLDDGLFFSDDAGETWSPVPDAPSHDLTAFAAPTGVDEGSPLLVGLDGGGVVLATVGTACPTIALNSPR